MKGNRDKLPTYWNPREDAAPTMKPKPSAEIKCPVSRKPIKMKEMVAVEFTTIEADGKEEGKSGNARYMCPLSRVSLTNSTKCVALRTSGKVGSSPFS